MSALVILWSQVQVLVGHQETLKPSSADFVISDRLLWVEKRLIEQIDPSGSNRPKKVIYKEFYPLDFGI